MFFKTGVLESLATVKHLRWRLSLLRLKKRLQHRGFPVNIVKFLKTAFFIEHLWWLLFSVWQSTCLILGLWRPLINQKHNAGWFLLKRSVDLSRVSSLHIISRNLSNKSLLINMRKKKLVQSKTLQQWLFVLMSRFRQI